MDGRGGSSFYATSVSTTCYSSPTGQSKGITYRFRLVYVGRWRSNLQVVSRHLCYLCSMTMCLRKRFPRTTHVFRLVAGLEVKRHNFPSAVSFVGNSLDDARDAVTFTQLVRQFLRFLPKVRMNLLLLFGDERLNCLKFYLKGFQLADSVFK